jgi:hypothetical protein
MRSPVVWCALGHQNMVYRNMSYPNMVYPNMVYRNIPLPWDIATPCICSFAMWNGITGKILELIRNSLPHWTISTGEFERWQR